MKFRVWCDSGANHASCREDIEEIDMTEAEFEEMTADEKEEMFREIALDRLEWGWERVD